MNQDRSSPSRRRYRQFVEDYKAKRLDALLDQELKSDSPSADGDESGCGPGGVQDSPADRTERKSRRRRYLREYFSWLAPQRFAVSAFILLAQTFFIFYAVRRAPQQAVNNAETVGKTLSIGQGMYTEYLLPVEIVGVLLLMAIIGGVVLARRFSQPHLELVVDQELDERGLEEEKGDYRVSI